jgi:hypothetical protein
VFIKRWIKGWTDWAVSASPEEIVRFQLCMLSFIGGIMVPTWYFMIVLLIHKH